ncbi:MAG: TlpA family protein disulfide reductase [Bacteroidales bacterium]|nr:TlpA family protein disulfide reductase [Bacteroidales bacterium]
MASLQERLNKWKARKWHQKMGDIVFWLFLVMLIVPGPRKFIATNLNKVMLHLRHPSIENYDKAYQLSAGEYNWDIYNESGQPVTPEDLKGKVIFLNFWGTYCPPCIAEMPEIQEIYDEYSDEVMFVLVTAENPEKVGSFLDDKGYDLPVFFGGRQMPEALSVRSIPTTFIIGKDGRIVTKKIGAADWNSRATRKVFNELLTK